MPEKSTYKIKALKKLMPETKEKIKSFLGEADVGRFELKNPGKDYIGDMCSHFLVNEGQEILAYGEAQFITDDNKLYAEICGEHEAGVLLVKRMLREAEEYALGLTIWSSKSGDNTLLCAGMKITGVDYMLSYPGNVCCEEKCPDDFGWREEYSDFDDAWFYAITGADNEIISSCNVNEYDRSICISSVYTKEKYRRQGFGAALIKKIISKYSDREILLHVYAENEKALSLYLKLGFEVKETVYTYTGM